MLALFDLDLLPNRMLPANMKESVDTFAGKLLKLVFPTFSDHSYERRDHKKCHGTETFHDEVNKILLAMPDGVLESQKAHLVAQSEKLPMVSPTSIENSKRKHSSYPAYSTYLLHNYHRNRGLG